MFYNPSSKGIKNKRGLSPLQAAYNSLKASNNRLTAQAHLYENRGATNIISSGSDLVIGSKERDSLQKNTDKILGGAKNFNKSIVTTANVRVTPLGMSPTDLKLIEAKELDLRDICNAFGVPSTLFNDQAASTLDNLKVGTKMMYTNAVIPNNEKLVTQFNKSIVPAYSVFENKQLRVRQDLSGIDALQEDQLTKAQKKQTEINTLLAIASNQDLTDEQKTSLYNDLGYEL
jgi:HK97 family phage portal protein